MKIRTIAFATAACLALAACGGGKDEAPEAGANVSDITVPETPATVNISTEAPAAPTGNVAEAPVPEASPTPVFSDEQTQTDAEATGMTARVKRDEGNEGTPAEQ
jgi:ABC-type glycerol-3-phosphate transport system substrate-binding protein